MKIGIPSISTGNTKIGKILNINLPPCITCKGMKCLNDGCYALKAYRRYTNIRNSWHNNYSSFKKSLKSYFDNIILTLSGKRKPVGYFRWHSAGEIPNQTYVNGMIRVAEAFPQIKFLAFTKKYGLDYSACPENLTILFSTWPGLRIPKSILEQNYVAWMNDGKSQVRRIKEKGKNPRKCSGSCVKCKFCWNINKIKQDVVFDKH